jgi:hypothetical protein
MTSPRRYDGVGYYAPSFASETPIYDSLVAERGVPQIAPINVPAALPPAYDNGYRPSSFGGYGSNLPALPAPRLALGPGPSSPGYGAPSQPQPQYAAPQLPAQQYGAPQFGAPQFGQQFATPQYGGAPQPQIPQQQGPGQQFPQQQPPAPAYQRPVAPVAPLRPVQYQEQYPPYPQQQRGGYQGH